MPTMMYFYLTLLLGSMFYYRTILSVTTNYNISKANLGHLFFQRLIDQNESFKNVNEENLCWLMHFFFREASHNGQSTPFSSGMFVLYDSTRQFFLQLMMAKQNQLYNNDHRSGYVRRLKHFLLDSIHLGFGMITGQTSSISNSFIYLRGDESSHFHERGDRHDRWNLYPAYGIDIPHGCMPNHFTHILFGKLKDLPGNGTYRGDRIYIKPELYGLQRFPDYIGHTLHYIKTVLHKSFCRFFDHVSPDICLVDGLYQEWTDRKLIKKWTQILTTIPMINSHERRQMHDQVSSLGIREIYRQMLSFPSIPEVNKYREELEHRYGQDVRSRKGNEIIFTTEQLLDSFPSFSSMYLHASQSHDQQCQIINQ